MGVLTVFSFKSLKSIDNVHISNCYAKVSQFLISLKCLNWPKSVLEREIGLLVRLEKSEDKTKRIFNV